jgi:hypothetical protein
VTKVNINGAGHQVEIDHDGPLDYVIDHARKLWEQTKPDDSAGAAYGFTAQTNVHANGRRYGSASFRHGEQPVIEP